MFLTRWWKSSLTSKSRSSKSQICAASTLGSKAWLTVQSLTKNPNWSSGNSMKWLISKTMKSKNSRTFRQLKGKKCNTVALSNLSIKTSGCVTPSPHKSQQMEVESSTLWVQIQNWTRSCKKSRKSVKRLKSIQETMFKTPPMGLMTWNLRLVEAILSTKCLPLGSRQSISKRIMISSQSKIGKNKRQIMRIVMWHRLDVVQSKFSFISLCKPEQLATTEPRVALVSKSLEVCLWTIDSNHARMEPTQVYLIARCQVESWRMTWGVNHLEVMVALYSRKSSEVFSLSRWIYYVCIGNSLKLCSTQN